MEEGSGKGYGVGDGGVGGLAGREGGGSKAWYIVAVFENFVVVEIGELDCVSLVGDEYRCMAWRVVQEMQLMVYSTHPFFQVPFLQRFVLLHSLHQQLFLHFRNIKGCISRRDISIPPQHI